MKSQKVVNHIEVVDITKHTSDFQLKYQSDTVLDHLRNITSYEMSIKECMAKWVINQFGYPNDVFFYERDIDWENKEWGFRSAVTGQVFCKCVETLNGLNRKYEYFAPKDLLAKLELIRH